MEMATTQDHIGGVPHRSTAAPRAVRAASHLNARNAFMAAVALLLCSMLIRGIVFNTGYGWPAVLRYLVNGAILRGLAGTLELTAVSMAGGIAFGTVLAVLRLSGNQILSGFAWAYVWFFRGLPLLVQVVFWYNLAALYPRLSLGVPFGPSLISGTANRFITPFIAAILALGLHEAAQMAEIVRGGITGVDTGQVQAARALGMKPGLTLRLVVLPQALRLIIPPTGNRVISLLKDTALVSVIAVPEVLYNVQQIYSQNFETIPLLIVACLWYLLVSSVLMAGQRHLERRLGGKHGGQATGY